METSSGSLAVVSVLREVLSTLTHFLDGREIPEETLDAQLLKVEVKWWHKKPLKASLMNSNKRLNL